MNGPLIEGKGLTWRAGRQEVLTGVDVTVSSGEIVTLVGPNGAGKTTLVRLLLGITPPSSGVVTRRPDLRIGYLPQRLRVNETLPLTVRRFLSLAMKDRAGVRKSTQDGTSLQDETSSTVRSTGDLLQEVGAERLGRHFLHELSGGEFQRVLLARALARDPHLLVLDEPVQGVDVTGQLELYDRIARLRDERGCGVLLVSHDLHLVMSATDRVVCLNGHVCCSGHPDSVVRDPAYVGLFGARAVAGLALYAHHHDHRHDTQDPISEPSPDPPNTSKPGVGSRATSDHP